MDGRSDDWSRPVVFDVEFWLVAIVGCIRGMEGGRIDTVVGSISAVLRVEQLEQSQSNQARCYRDVAVELRSNQRQSHRLFGSPLRLNLKRSQVLRDLHRPTIDWMLVFAMWPRLRSKRLLSPFDAMQGMVNHLMWTGSN